MKNSTKMLAAAGLLAGGTLGLLFAPQKGADTRRKIAKDLRRMAVLLEGPCNKNQLMAIKERLERHKQNLDSCLQKINSKLDKTESRDMKTAI
jgi:gas vesicle protein